jgi:hypothetical protein
LEPTGNGKFTCALDRWSRKWAKKTVVGYPSGNWTCAWRDLDGKWRTNHGSGSWAQEQTKRLAEEIKIECLDRRKPTKKIGPAAMTNTGTDQDPAPTQEKNSDLEEAQNMMQNRFFYWI